MNKKGIATIGIVITVLFTFPFSSSAIIGMQAADQIYKTAELTPERDVALVLGAAAYPTRLSDILADRVDTSIELYEAGKVGKLVMSGAANEAEGMKRHAVERGVPAQDIIEDPAGLNTMASVKNLAENWDSAVIVTQRYHLPRALFIAGSQDIDAVGTVADKQEYLKIFEFKKRELLATSKALYDIYLAK